MKWRILVLTYVLFLFCFIWMSGGDWFREKLFFSAPSYASGSMEKGKTKRYE